MTEFLVIGGTRVPIAAPRGADEEYQEIGGEMVRAFSGRLLSTVRSRARVWRLQTIPLPDTEAQLLAAALTGGVPLACSGALIGGEVLAYARAVRTRPVPPASRLQRIVDFELHEADAPRPRLLFRWSARRPYPPLTTTRSTPATYRDRSGVIRTAGPGVLRTTWRNGRPYALVEPSGENLIPVERRTFEGWTKHQGAEVTVTQGHTIPGYSPEGAATRIQTSGGENAMKYYATSMGNRDGGAESQSIVIQNIGTVAVRIVTNNGPPQEIVEPGETRLVRTSSETTASGSSRQMQFRAPTADDDLDFIAYAPQVEVSPIATSYIPGETRDRDLVSVGYAHAPGSCAVLEAGLEAGGSLVGDAHTWQIGSGGSPQTRSLRVRRQNQPAVYILELGNGADRVWSRVSENPSLGAEYLRLGLLDVDEAAAQARVRLMQRWREPGGAWVDADGGWSAWLDVSELLALGWQSPHLTIGNVREGTRAGRLMMSDMAVLDTAGLDAERITIDDAARVAL